MSRFTSACNSAKVSLWRRRRLRNSAANRSCRPTAPKRVFNLSTSSAYDITPDAPPSHKIWDAVPAKQHLSWANLSNSVQLLYAAHTSNWIRNVSTLDAPENLSGFINRTPFALALSLSADVLGDRFRLRRRLSAGPSY